MTAGNDAAGAMRVDVWLDIACLFKTRSEAKRACEGGKVDVNGEHARPNRLVREGDRLRISRGFGRYQDVVVRILIDQHVKKSEARALYDDVTPVPTPAEIEMRRMERTYRAAAQAAGTPDRRRRREIRRLKGL
ncbi:MAG TPA: RNA-binding S4 domain-containing protein [Vicinamibacterales bacterium]|nr:RNA-binding S4 domain-containing protein [Vicinamibacterales bacterium]